MSDLTPIGSKPPTLLCTYCLTRKPWDSRHFPTPYAKCRACIQAQSSGSTEAHVGPAVGGSESRVAPGQPADGERSAPPTDLDGCATYTAAVWSPLSNDPEDGRCLNCGQPELAHSRSPEHFEPRQPMASECIEPDDVVCQHEHVCPDCWAGPPHQVAVLPR